MAGASIKKRSFSDGPKGRAARPSKKQKKQQQYHSDSEEEDDEGGPVPANLLDSDEEDLDNMVVDDGASTGSEDSDDSQSEDDEDDSRERNPKSKQPLPKSPHPKKNKKQEIAKDAPESSDDSSDDGENGDDDEEDEDDNDDPLEAAQPNTKSKRNDPSAFAESISKMLSSKLPASKRADPIVARSAESAKAAREMADAALEAKARKRLREQKRLALEKGRVRDVLVASTTRQLNIATGEVEEIPIDDKGGETTEQILATERRLRKVAQRGVVKLFNAVRAAQVKALEAERVARNEGIVGAKRKEEKVTEMSRKGFLELIASGGGGLKKGGLEEA
ncbi:Rrp15p-domain-containing protein [Diplogelasinospora grovesii]|uniref:Rrp15p-domain-containing protein n=1 Tax=Diplogelasinospora grovesii TaxID=303347 RepID=A0AAN6NIJ0_9PEZI|nr:Rrp15p-domain-containing protein [Diplogelasinospora grovesii]